MNLAACTLRELWRGWAAPAARRFERAMHQPEVAQRAVLATILRENAATGFGRSHGFGRLASAEDFVQAVPPRSYDQFQPWLAAAAAGHPSVLTAGRPRAFLPTSGTSTGAKLIPWTGGLQREFNAALGPWMHGFMRSDPAAWRGSAYWSLSPPVWHDRHTAGGIPIGFASDASYLPAILRPLLNAAFAVPAALATLRDPQVWRYATLLHLLAAEDLSLMSVWSPTFLTSLMDPLTEWWPALLADMEAGTSSTPGAAPGGTALALGLRRPRRARALRAMTTAAGHPPAPAEIWPHLAVISCWTDAAARAPAQRLAGMFPQARVAAKGLLATEGVVSIPWPEAAAPALALTSHFLEFVDDAGQVHPAWDLSRGACYSVLLTTGGGLYRYQLNDRIRVVGCHACCPLVEFVGRDGITCDLCGEKLAEPFVRACLEQVAREWAQDWPFALLAPSSPSADSVAGYSLFVCGMSPGDEPAIARAVEAALAANVHYAHARRLGQLVPVKPVAVAGTADQAWVRFHAVHAGRGQRLGDIKPAALDAHPGWEKVFASTTFPLRP